MTTTTTPQPPRLRAVPPSGTPSQRSTPRPADLTPPASPGAESTPAVKPNRGSGRRWLNAAGAVVGLGCISLVPMPQRVTGPGEVMTTGNAFEKVFMPDSGGTLSEILVTTDQPVTAHTAIALLDINSLENQLVQTEQQHTQGLAQLTRYRQQVPLRQGEVEIAASRVATAQQEVNRLQTELSRTPPAVQGWQGEIAALNAEIAGLQGQAQLITDRIERAQEAIEAGAVSQIEADGWLAQQSQLHNQIAAKQGQITAKQAQIEGFYQDKQAELNQAQAQLAEQQAAVQATQQGVQAAAAEATAQEQLTSLQAEELVRQQDQLADLQVLRTTITGKVVTSQQEIDGLRGRYIEPGQLILEVVNPAQLTVDVWVRQEDQDLVQVGMAAEFRPQSGEWERYPAEVITVSPRAEFNEAAQKPMVRVTLRLVQADPSLQLNATGTARIQTEALPMYAKLRREFLKVVPLQKLWAF